jgi:hypothetical protein
MSVREEIKEWLNQLPNFECKDFEEVELENKRLERENIEALNRVREEEEKVI